MTQYVVVLPIMDMELAKSEVNGRKKRKEKEEKRKKIKKT